MHGNNLGVCARITGFVDTVKPKVRNSDSVLNNDAHKGQTSGINVLNALVNRLNHDGV